MGKLCGAAVKTSGSMEKKRYNAGNRAGYSATLDGAGMAVLNPRASAGARAEERAFACRIRNWGPLKISFYDCFESLSYVTVCRKKTASFLQYQIKV